MNEDGCKHARHVSLIKQSTDPEVIFSDGAHLTTLPELAKTSDVPFEANFSNQSNHRNLLLCLKPEFRTLHLDAYCTVPLIWA